MKKIPVVLLLTLLLSLCLFGETNNNGKSSVPLFKPTETSDVWLDINRLAGVFRNNGIWDFDVIKNTQGTEWPKGSGNSPIFAGGQWISASFNGEKRVAAIIHSASEYQAGMVLSPGVADNSKDPKYKWYQLRSSGTDDRDRWPVDQGAAVDANGDPLLLGDQTIFSVWNDLADHSEFGTNKLSVEVQQTAWAYNRADALGDMHFIKWRMVNKSGVAWDSTYFTIWLDPDLGDASDDLVGCDTTLGLGFTYNEGNADQIYGSPPPAQGIDFFQGPIVDEVGSSVTLPNGTVIADKTMRKMTSFVFYDNDDSNSGNPQDANDVWNYQTGFWRNDNPITFGDRGSTAGNPPTSFMFPGDPETEQSTGWLDYSGNDRRFLMTTGPFPMPAWVDVNGNGLADFGEPGVQDIVAGVIMAKGADNLNSVTKLKEVDGLAQLAYDLNFNLSKSPLPPVVSVSEVENSVVLTWDETSEFNTDGTPYASEDPIVSAALGDTVIIDNVVQVIDDADYNFYGYSVYQYADPSGASPVLIEHWDIGPTSSATPYTKQRYAIASLNKNPAVANSGTPLVNGKEYYFGVVAEAYLAFGAPKVFTSPATIVTVVPRSETGARIHAAYKDTLDIVHAQVDANLPLSDGSALVWVVDPAKVTGDNYAVVFENDVWHLLNTTKGDTVLKNQTNQRGDDAYNVVDGLLVKVLGPTLGVHGMWQVANGNGPIAGWETENEDEDIFWVHWAFSATANYPTEQAQGGWFFQTWGGGTANDEESFLARVFRAPNWTHAAANVYDMRFTAGTHYAYERFTGPELIVEVPFELWNLGPNPNDTSDDYRMCPAILNNDADVGYTFTGDDASSSAANDPISDWIYWGDPDVKSPGEAGYNSFFAPGVGNAPSENWTEVLARTTLMNWNTYVSAADSALLTSFPHPDTLQWDATDTTFMLNRGWFLDPDNSNGVVTIAGGYAYGTVLGLPEEGTIIRWITNKPNTQNDSYTFTSKPAKTLAASDMKGDFKKIKVVPNPYYGYHSGELDPFDRWVQFTYLPPKCTVRIFDLAGNLIRKLEKDDATTPFMQWDMKNEYQLPVASGVYVFHVDAPGVGEKIGKIAIFTPNERLDTY